MIASESSKTADPTLRKVVVEASGYAFRRYGQWGLTTAKAAEHTWQWVLDHGDWVQEIMDEHERTWPRVLGRIAKAECDFLGDAHRCAALGIHPWENFHYTTAGVEVALRAALDPAGWLDAPVPELPGVAFNRPPAPHSDWIVSLADVTRAMRHLPKRDQLTLEALFRSDVPNKVVAEACGVSSPTMSDRKEAILRKMVDFLGGPKPRRQCIDTCTHPERPIPKATKA